MDTLELQERAKKSSSTSYYTHLTNVAYKTINIELSVNTFGVINSMTFATFDNWAISVTLKTVPIMVTMVLKITTQYRTQYSLAYNLNLLQRSLYHICSIDDVSQNKKGF